MNQEALLAELLVDDDALDNAVREHFMLGHADNESKVQCAGPGHPSSPELRRQTVFRPACWAPEGPIRRIEAKLLEERQASVPRECEDLWLAAPLPEHSAEMAERSAEAARNEHRAPRRPPAHSGVIVKDNASLAWHAEDPSGATERLASAPSAAITSHCRVRANAPARLSRGVYWTCLGLAAAAVLWVHQSGRQASGDLAGARRAPPREPVAAQGPSPLKQAPNMHGELKPSRVWRFEELPAEGRRPVQPLPPMASKSRGATRGPGWPSKAETTPNLSRPPSTEVPPRVAPQPEPLIPAAAARQLRLAPSPAELSTALAVGRMRATRCVATDIEVRVAFGADGRVTALGPLGARLEPAAQNCLREAFQPVRVAPFGGEYATRTWIRRQR